MSILNKNPRHEYKDSKQLPRRLLSLGWLLGFFHRASVRSLVTLVPLLVWAFLFTWKRRKKLKESNEYQDKPRNQEDIIRSEDMERHTPEPTIDISHLPKQRFVVRRRNTQGQLKHIATFDHPPTRKDLESYGHGDYSVLTTKPFLKQWTRIHIEPETKLQKPIRRKAKINGDNPLKPASNNPSSLNTQEKIRKCLTDIERKLEKSDYLKPKTASHSIREKAKTYVDVAQLSAKPQNIQHHSLNGQKGQPKLDNSKQISKPYQPLYRPIKEPQQQMNSLLEKKQEENSNECYKCGRKLNSFIRCEFCQNIFCDDYLEDCYKLHYCPDSYVCTICSKRIAAEEATLGPFCNNAFCSVRCLTKCLEKNDNNPDCTPCVNGDLVEEDEFDCDGDCSDCTSDDCEDRCEQHGKCKNCRAYEECEISCELAEDGCEKGFCKGFDCEDRLVESMEDEIESENSDDEDSESEEDEEWEDED